MKPPKLTEKAFMAQVVQLARLLGYLVYHTHDSRRSARGFPDLVLCRERVIYVELKTDTGKTTPDQDAWLDRLTAAGEEVYLWRPSDWPNIERILMGKEKPCV